MGRQISLEFLPNLIGVPYEEKDCWDIVKEFYIYAFGIDLSDYDIVPQDRKNNATQIKKQSIFFKKIEEPKLGDILLFRVLGHNSHVGVYLGENRFLHSSKGMNCVVDNLHNWKRRIEGIYRWPNLE